MIYVEKDPTTGVVEENDLSVLPYVSIPKDTLTLASQLLSVTEFGNVMMDLVNELYLNCQYKPKTEGHTEKVVLGMMKENIGRLSKKYFKKIKNLKNQDKEK